MIADFHVLCGKIWSRCLMRAYKAKFKSVGERVIFDPINSRFSYGTINIGNDVFIAARAWFSADRSNISIGSFVMFGPNVTIAGGDHDIERTDMPMYLVTEKPDKCDADVVIKDDVWVGANTIILKGVTIGCGAVIAAGSLVNKDVEPYCIYAGVPAKKIRNRFSEEELLIYKENLKLKGLVTS